MVPKCFRSCRKPTLTFLEEHPQAISFRTLHRSLTVELAGNKEKDPVTTGGVECIAPTRSDCNVLLGLKGLIHECRPATMAQECLERLHSRKLLITLHTRCNPNCNL